MAEVVGFIQAVGLMILILGFLAWTTYLIYKGLSFLAKRIYYLTKKKDEKKYAWCVDAIKNGNSENTIKALLFVDGWKKKDIEEMVWIYRKCKKKLKGGKKKK